MYSQIIRKAQSDAGRGASGFDFASKRHGMSVRSGFEHARAMVCCDETVIGMHCSLKAHSGPAMMCACPSRRRLLGRTAGAASLVVGAVMGHERQRESETGQRLTLQKGMMRTGALRCTSALCALGWRRAACSYTMGSRVGCTH
jgi:hypothetical protein